MTKSSKTSSSSKNSEAKRITVHAHPGSSKEAISERAPGAFDVWVHASAVDNKANDAIIRAVARHLGVAPSRLVLSRGATSKIKILTAT